MNKRMIAVIIIGLVLIGICIWEQVMVDSYLNDIYNQALYIQEYVEGMESVKDPKLMTLVEEMEEDWIKHEELLCFIVNHKDIDELTVEISRLKANIEGDQSQDFKSGINVIIHYTEAYHHIMGVSIQNIL